MISVSSNSSHLTVSKQMRCSRYFLQPQTTDFLIYMYKENLALTNLQGTICHKTKPYLIPVIEDQGKHIFTKTHSRLF